jgi:hypothetical protein
MATKDNNIGLLSKVAKFVLNPTKDWSELDKLGKTPESDSDLEGASGFSKKALKQMIERKRQNDFVRRREFDELRKLRRNVPQLNLDLAARPSFFQNSTTSNLDERAKTLQKIDEIEAHMSKQWWKGKQDMAAKSVVETVVSVRSPIDGGDSVPATVPPSERGNIFSSTLNSDSKDDFGLDDEADSAIAGLRVADSADAATHRGQGFDRSSRGRMLATKSVAESLTDPDLQEAAIRFANGDDAGAEEGLLSLLRTDPIEPEVAHRWAMALFDLYRSTGQQGSFDQVAIDYAMRFGQSAPAWFSTPELVKARATIPGSVSESRLGQSSQVSWECPAELDLKAVQAMQSNFKDASQRWNLNWGQLATMTHDAGRALAELFALWCSQPVKLHFDRADVLEQVLRALTTARNLQQDLFWWQLRLDALRILRQQDEFELVALDYCVVNEVSPPPWQNPRCEYMDDGASANATSASQMSTMPMGLEEAIPASAIELSGELLGDVTRRLNALLIGLKESSRLVISCDLLIRVDFPAAGSILNWVALRESEGCHVQFRNVPRLVAAFFKVIGIHENARVLVRTR